MNACEENSDLMMRSLDGMLNPAEERTLKTHLRKCARCARDSDLLRMADGLLRAVSAPEVAANDWPPILKRMTEAADDGRKVMAVAAEATEPPSVGEKEWSEVWSGIEREALLGERREVQPTDISPARRKRSVWSKAAIGAAAAVLLAVGVYLVLRGMLQPVNVPPLPLIADEVQVGRGYAYAVINTGSEEPVYVVMALGSLERSRVSTGSGYMHSVGEGEGVIEVAPRNQEKPIEVPLRGTGE